MVLQQLAQLRQSTSCHTALSAASVAAANFLGVVFSSTVRNLRNLLLLCLALYLNDRRLICCMLNDWVANMIECIQDAKTIFRSIMELDFVWGGTSKIHYNRQLAIGKGQSNQQPLSSPRVLEKPEGCVSLFNQHEIREN
jgi:hypothetical protein